MIYEYFTSNDFNDIEKLLLFDPNKITKFFHQILIQLNLN